MAIFDVIKLDQPNDILVAKFPGEDFNTLSQLIVHESQEALLFKDGQALDLFGPGRYTMHTQNIPLLRNLIEIPTGGVSPFHCEVYFVNKTESMNVRWGTSSRVDYMDPKYNAQMQIGCGGEMTFSVSDARKLIVKLVGTDAILGREQFTQYLRSFLDSKVKPYLANVMMSGQFSIFDIDSHMGELSTAIHTMMIPDFADYGISLEKLMVTRVVKPTDNSTYQRLLEIFERQTVGMMDLEVTRNYDLYREETEAQRVAIEASGQARRRAIEAQGEAAAMDTESEAVARKRQREGYTYQQERGFDVAGIAAGNEGVGEFTNLGIGMGLVGGIGSSISGGVASMAGGAMQSAFDGSNFTGGFAQPAQQTAQPAPASNGLDEFRVRVEKLKMMHDMGMLDDDEFAAQKQRLIDGI